MKQGPDIATVASLLADPARSNIVLALMSGKALTASELAKEAGITAATASSHLSRLLQAEFVVVCKQGRHRFYALADDDVADIVERLIGFSAKRGGLRFQPGPKDKQLRVARVCYNHLAGERGVQVYESLMQRDFLNFHADELTLTEQGVAFVSSLGITPTKANKAHIFCKPCLDWSERRHHLAGKLGNDFLQMMIANKWAKRLPDTRIVAFSQRGIEQFESHFPR